MPLPAETELCVGELEMGEHGEVGLLMQAPDSRVDATEPAATLKRLACLPSHIPTSHSLCTPLHFRHYLPIMAAMATKLQSQKIFEKLKSKPANKV